MRYMTELPINGTAMTRPWQLNLPSGFKVRGCVKARDLRLLLEMEGDEPLDSRAIIARSGERSPNVEIRVFTKRQLIEDVEPEWTYLGEGVPSGGSEDQRWYVFGRDIE